MPILAIAFVVTALISVFLIAVTTKDSSTTTTTNQESFENVSDVKKKSEKSPEEYSSGGLTDALHFADGVIISLNRDLETAEVKIATPGYGLNSGNVYTFGFSERIERRIISFDDLNIGDEVRVEYMYFLNKDETLHGEYIVRGSVETRPSARNATADG
ncbi:hypothetical protein [Ellagibacter isourolithinifaciens]|uniref:hypothetical protein n=1 Tax=Ellagibacter isourolithinifaciens TaxID=2137581 RepID=UPI003A957D50